MSPILFTFVVNTTQAMSCLVGFKGERERENDEDVDPEKDGDRDDLGFKIPALYTDRYSVMPRIEEKCFQSLTYLQELFNQCGVKYKTIVLPLGAFIFEISKDFCSTNWYPYMEVYLSKFLIVEISENSSGGMRFKQKEDNSSQKKYSS